MYMYYRNLSLVSWFDEIKGMEWNEIDYIYRWIGLKNTHSTTTTKIYCGGGKRIKELFFIDVEVH